MGTSAPKEPSSRRRHLLADLSRMAPEFEYPLLDLGGSRSVALSPTHLEGGRRTDAFVVNIDPSALPDVVADAHVLPFPDASFQTVLFSETLEHLHSPVRAVDEIRRVLRPGGRVIATVPFNFRVHGDPDDYQRYTASGLRVLFAGGFTVETVKAQGGPWSVIACALRDVLYGAKPRWMPRWLRDFLLRRLPSLAARDEGARVQRSPMLAGWTTGYLLVASRR